MKAKTEASKPLKIFYVHTVH